MTKQELNEVFTVLTKEYPDQQFEPAEWWDMFKNHFKDAVIGGIKEWKNGQYGYRPPTPLDVRYTSEVCIWNPDGIFYQAMMKIMKRREETNNDGAEANEEIRNG